jgi:hypothetical protein
MKNLFDYIQCRYKNIINFKFNLYNLFYMFTNYYEFLFIKFKSYTIYLFLDKNYFK